MNKLGYPIVGDVPQRVAKYEKSGVRKIKYKMLDIIKHLLNDIKYKYSE